MPIRLRGLDFLLTYNCPGHCAHCSYSAGPGRGGRLSVAEVEESLRQVADHPLEWVALLGGEPFIYMDDLVEMVRLVRQLTSARPEVFTNAYWAYDDDEARRRLSALKDAGLDYILFSVDGFHAPFFGVARAALGIRIAKELGFDEIVVDNQWVGSPDLDIPINANTRMMMEHLADMVDLDGVTVQASITHPVGRGAEALPEMMERAGMMPKGLCEAGGLCVAPYYLAEDLRAPYAVEIHPDGEVNLCAGISLGNIHERPLGEILESYDYSRHPIIKVLAEEGPTGLLPIAEEAGYEPLRGYLNRCHLCYEVRRFLYPRYPEYLKPVAIYERG